MSVSIFIVGAGRVGSSLGKALNSKDFRITHMYHHNKNRSQLLNSEFPDATHWYRYDCLPVEESDLILITTPDDFMQEVVQRLLVLSESWQKKTCIHTSGLLSSAILNPLKAKGAAIASLHPMQSINTLVADASIFHDIILTFEGSDSAKELCQSLATKIKAHFREISSERKIQYHLAGTIASNLLVGIIDSAAQLFSESGFQDSEKFHIIQQLNARVLDNYVHGDISSSLTGPIQRGDVKSIEQHLDYLKKKDPEVYAIYKSLSKYILDHFTEHEKALLQKISELLK